MNVQNYLKKVSEDHHFTYISDSALYTQKFLLNKEITRDWITRVPESISQSKEILESNYDKILLHKVDENYKIMETIQSYAGIKQRWILVRNRKSKYKELATF